MVKILCLFLFSLTLFSKVNYQQYCTDNSLRETTIVIDLNSIDSILYGKVIKTLSFIPHEKINVLVYMPKEHQVKTIYSFCYPQYTQAEIRKIKSASSWKKLMGTKLDKMTDDNMFAKSTLTGKLAKAQGLITSVPNSNFTNALASISSDLEDQSRIILFTKEKFDIKRKDIDFRNANVFIYQKELSSKKIIENNKKFFANNNGYLSKVRNRVNSSVKEINSSLKHYEANFNMFVKNRSMKSKVLLNIDSNGNIENGWMEIPGVLKTPLHGKTIISNNKIKLLKAKVPAEFKYGSNVAYKGDKLELKINNNKYQGKYYNYAFTFADNENKYFEYKVK